MLRKLVILATGLLIQQNLFGCNPIFKPVGTNCSKPNLIVFSPEGPAIEARECKIALPITYPVEIRLGAPRIESLRHNCDLSIVAIEFCELATLESIEFRHPERRRSELSKNESFAVDVPNPCKGSGITFHEIHTPDLQTAMKSSVLLFLYEFAVPLAATADYDCIILGYVNPAVDVLIPKEISQFRPKPTKDFGLPCQAQVLTKNGPRAIDQCHPGTRLVCFDFKKQEWASSLVISLKKTTANVGLIRLTANGEDYQICPDQQLFSLDKLAWVAASQVKNGEKVLKRNSTLDGPTFLPIRIDSVATIASQPICVLELEEHETYCFGQEQLLTHNCRGIAQNGTSIKTIETSGNDCLKMVGPDSETAIKTGLQPDGKTTRSFFPCKNLHSYCVDGRVYLSRHESTIHHSDQSGQSHLNFDWANPDKDLLRQALGKEYPDPVAPAVFQEPIEPPQSQCQHIPKPLLDDQSWRRPEPLTQKPKHESPLTFEVSGWPKGTTDISIDTNAIRYLFGRRGPSIDQIERYAFFIDENFQELSRACQKLNPMFKNFWQLSAELKAEKQASIVRDQCVAFAHEQDRKIQEALLVNQGVLWLGHHPSLNSLTGQIAELGQYEINPAFVNLCQLVQAGPRILESVDAERLESTLSNVLTSVAKNWGQIKKEDPAISARDLILPILSIALLTTLGICSLGGIQLIATLGYQIARHAAPMNRPHLKRALFIGAATTALVKRAINPADILAIGIATTCGADFADTVASILAFNCVFKGATLAINTNVGRAALSSGKKALTKFVSDVQAGARKCVEKLNPTLAAERAYFVNSECAAEKQLFKNAETIAAKAEIETEKVAKIESKAESMAAKIEDGMVSAEVIANRETVELIAKAETWATELISQTASRIDQVIPKTFSCIEEKIYWSTWSILENMPFGGKLINGRWYKHHVLERMAPRTKEVINELKKRFPAYWEKIKHKSKTKDYCSELQKYLDARTISPIDIEHAIKTGVPAPRPFEGTINYETGVLTVAVNATNDIVSVIVTNHKAWKLFKGFY